MCMVIHELATNAVKHGSLSIEKGRVVVETEILKGGDAVKLTWTESNGPQVVNVQDSGTGTSLLEGLVDHEMNGTIVMEFSETGLVCQIEVPLTLVD